MRPMPGGPMQVPACGPLYSELIEVENKLFQGPPHHMAPQQRQQMPSRTKKRRYADKLIPPQVCLH